MATTGDPWQTLGLAPGASLDDVRRAYRRLAKANHPDAAGEAALPRFLAIQAAYESIAGPALGRRIGGRPSAASRSTPPAAPWRADPDRARASGRADGRRPGARPSGRPPAGSAGAGATGGAGGGGGTGGGAEAGTGASAGSSGGSAERPRGGSAGRSRRSSRGPPKPATPYSTSYDAVDEEPFEPGWSGATWYGASSGTYWTINPKEYADPRKHGPEYQARARRSRGGWILDDEDAVPAPDPRDSPPDTEPDASGRAPDPGAAARERPRSDRPSPAGTSPRASAPRPTGPPVRSRESPAGARPGDGPPAGSPPPSAAASTAFAMPGGPRAPLLPEARTGAGRAAIAVLGWLPLAMFAMTAIGESTGCGRYAASCGEASSPGTWIVGAAILILLLALPAVARWSAHGTVAMVVIGVPGAVILSAAGGTNLREASAPILLAVLALAYLVGIGYAVIAPRLGAPAQSGPGGSIR